MVGLPPNLHTIDSRSACIQGVLKVKVKVKGHVIRALLCWHENRFFSQANGPIATKLAHDGHQVIFINRRLHKNEINLTAATRCAAIRNCCTAFSYELRGRAAAQLRGTLISRWSVIVREELPPVSGIMSPVLIRLHA